MEGIHRSWVRYFSWNTVILTSSVGIYPVSKSYCWNKKYFPCIFYSFSLSSWTLLLVKWKGILSNCFLSHFNLLFYDCCLFPVAIHFLFIGGTIVVFGFVSFVSETFASKHISQAFSSPHQSSPTPKIKFPIFFQKY